jgi:type III secretion protein N (ATPase)
VTSGRGARLDFAAARERVRAAVPRRATGRVVEVTGLVLRAVVPGARIGELVRLGPDLDGEIVGFRDEEAVVMPLGELGGVGPDTEVEPLHQLPSVPCGEALLGHVLDGLGRIVDTTEPRGLQPWPLHRSAPDPLSRPRITRRLALGVRALDLFTTVGEGQRIGLFAGSGVGKSTLMGQIARHSDAEVTVIGLVGERGREVRDFLEGSLGPEGRRRSVVVAATSDAPSLVRLRAAFVATAVAEYFREQGARVLLMMDSVTRVARAQREVGLAAGEPPARQGYPPSVFALLPRLLERSGTSEKGSITALYTVLVAGGDMEEPIADEVRGILDGHVILSREIGARGHWPAVDVIASLSRVMDELVDDEHRKAAHKLRSLLAAYEQKRDLILLGAYQRGSDAMIDEAIARMPKILAVLKQARTEHVPFAESRRTLLQAAGA